jgi:hypothetical protein
LPEEAYEDHLEFELPGAGLTSIYEPDTEKWDEAENAGSDFRGG